MIRNGTDIKVIHNKTGEDLTKITLTQIILEEEKKKDVVPLKLLKGLIRHPGDTISEFFQQKLSDPVGNIIGNMHKTIDDLLVKVDDQLLAKLDGKIERALDSANPIPSLRQEVSFLRKKIEMLENKLLKLADRETAPDNQKETE